MSTDLLLSFFMIVLNISQSDHVISIFGSHMTITTSGKLVTYCHCVLWQTVTNQANFKEVMAFQVGWGTHFDRADLLYIQQEKG